ncbi:MAG: Multi-sensor signal transduction histidine kinase [Pedosphaera sp.]|nr:Multi-sensor signal transduction histidine kinase [Pedosphaera sp.]
MKAALQAGDRHIKTLVPSEIKGSPSPALLDDLVSLAAQVCGAPMALITRTEQGLAKPASVFGLTADDMIVVAALQIHSQVQKEIVVVSDTSADKELAQQTLANTGLHIGFYAGVPLLAPSGESRGVLCIMDREPRKFGPEAQETLKQLGRLATAQLGLTIDQSLVEESLLREQNLSESIINSLPGVFYLFNEEGKYLRWNRKLEKVTGYSSEEVARIHPLDFFTGDDKRLIASRIQKAVETGDAEAEAMLVAKDGTRRPYFFTGSLMQLQGEACILGMGMDITERKRVEQRHAALAKLGQSLSSATTPEEAARIIGDISDELFHWDAYALNLYNPDEGIIYPVLNVDTVGGKRREIPPPVVCRTPSVRSKRVLKEGAELVLKEEPIVMSTDTIPFGDTARPSASIMLVQIRNRTKVIGILSIHSYKVKAYDKEDLNLLQSLADHCGGALERIRAEAALKTSEVRFHSVWENSVDGMRLTDEQGLIVAVNEAFCKLVGMTAKELVDLPFTATYAETENLDNLLQKYRQRFQNQKVEKTIERKLTFRTGKAVDLEVTNSLIELPGNKRMVLGLFRDTTTHKKAEEELRKSEAELRLVWENSLDGMRLLNGAGTFLMVNEAFCRLVEKPRDALVGKPLSVIYDTAAEVAVMQKHREHFEAKLIPPHTEREVSLWNGKKQFWELSNSLLEVEGQPTLLLSVVRDITVSKRVQRKIQMLEQQRALEKERERIARDMHDDVGGSLTRITLLTEIAEAEIAAGKIVASEEAKVRIQKISAMSREVVRNIDEIVWAVDPGNDSLEKFASYICHLADELLKMTPVNYRLDVPTILPNYFLGSDIRHNLFLVVKESLNNVVKHSEATEVSLQMGIAATEFSITISDNGRGFETGKLKPFSNGLSNMRNRMEKIGGAIKLKSQLGHGTTVALAINLEK